MRKKILTITIIICVLFSCATYEKRSADENEYIKIAAVGDSITFGKSISNRLNNSYPVQLEQLLGFPWEVKNFGVSGATLLQSGNLPYRSTLQLKLALDFQPDVVIIALGTNDSKPVNWKNKDYFVRDYVNLINSFERLDSKPQIYICYPVPAYSDKFGINDVVIRDEIIPYINSIAEISGVEVIDLYSALLDKVELFPDTIHPDRSGAGLIAETIYSFLKNKWEL